MSSIIDPLARLVAERACERLIVDYSHLLDLGHADRVAALFVDDGIWEIPGEIRFAGRDELDRGIPQRLFAPGRTARHVCTNIAVDVITLEEAVSVCYLVNYRHDAGTQTSDGPVPASAPAYIGEYHDRFVRVPAGWRFAHRRVVLAFRKQ